MYNMRYFVLCIFVGIITVGLNCNRNGSFFNVIYANPNDKEVLLLENLQKSITDSNKTIILLDSNADNNRFIYIISQKSVLTVMINNDENPQTISIEKEIEGKKMLNLSTSFHVNKIIQHDTFYTLGDIPFHENINSEYLFDYTKQKNTNQWNRNILK